MTRLRHAFLLPPLVVATLAAQEESAVRWVSLFDGGSSVTEQWRGMDGSPFPENHWRVEDGCLKTVPALVGRDLVTADAFENFDLRFEWKIAPGGNSGVKYLVQEGRPGTYRNEILAAVAISFAIPVALLIAFRRRVRWIGPAVGVLVAASLFGAVKAREYLLYSSTGLEMQLLDNDRHPNGRDPLKRAGALYGLYAPVEGAEKPAGEWNTGRIVIRGGEVEHWLNGVRVVAYDLGSPDFQARLAASRFARIPGIGGKSGGHIVLQHHQDEIWFRNIRVGVAE